MSGWGALAAAALPRAHPVSGHPHVDVPVELLVALAAAAVVAALVLTPSGAPRHDVDLRWSWAGPLSRAELVSRAVAVVVLVLAVLAGRLGARAELDNLAPALVVGLTWPLLTAASLALPVWRLLDPWDALARALSPGDRSEPAGQVWPAVALVLPLAWFVGVYERPLDPRAIGLVLVVYTTLTVAGCLVAGRRRWLSSAEPLGILLTWTHAAARGRLGTALPRGGSVLVGSATGAMLFAVLRRTGFWSGNTPPDRAQLYATAGLLVCASLGAGLLLMAARVARAGTVHPVVAAGVLPVLVGVTVAFALERNRLFTSAQLLPGLLGDPLGRGWDLLGPSGTGVDPPLGAAGLVAVQIGAVALGCLWGAVVVARRTTRRDRLPAGVVLTYLAAVSVLLVGLH